MGPLGPTLLEWGVAAPPPNNTFPICYSTKFGRIGETVRARVRRSAGKLGPSRLVFKSVKSLEPTRIDRPPMTSYRYAILAYFVLYTFRDKRRFLSKIANFSHPLYLREFSLNFLTALVLKRLQSDAPTRRYKEFDDMCIGFDILPQCDGQTDGWICHSNIAVCMDSMLTRDKNSTRCNRSVHI